MNEYMPPVQPGLAPLRKPASARTRHKVLQVELDLDTVLIVVVRRPGRRRRARVARRRVLATPRGQDLYRHRQITIEPVFGQIKINRAIKRFQRRGRSACRSEWRLIAATHNLLKLHNHRLAAATS
jgi:hypothetical protein